MSATLGRKLTGPRERALTGAAIPKNPPVAPGAAASELVQDSETAEPVLKSVLSVITALGPPLTIATALMFYFGWARSNVQAHYMGLDLSLFGYSTQDYLLLSISTLYLPLLATALFILGWLALHQRIDHALRQHSSRSALRSAGRAARTVGLLMAASAIVTASLDRKWSPLIIPLILAVGAAIAAYGQWLVRAASDADPQTMRVPPWHRALHALLVGSVITLALVWEVSNYAGVVGRGYAMEIARTVSTLPRATAFGTTPLGIQASGVHEERIDPHPNAAKDTSRYRTTGLRFLTRSGGRMFLVHDGWTPEHGTVIVLPDNDQIRWQFSL